MLHAELEKGSGKIYHVRDVGAEAIWSAARANPDSALFDGGEEIFAESTIFHVSGDNAIIILAALTFFFC
jgi:hypothetical protein